MKHQVKNYHLPRSVDEALALLENSGESCALIAGGTDLLLEMRQSDQVDFDTLIDISCIDSMQHISTDENYLYIGACVPLTLVAQDALVNQFAQAVAEASGLIGGAQVRNVGTLGGNVAHALPAADGAIALLALQAEAGITSRAGERFLPLQDVYIAPRKSALEKSRELITQFRIPLIQQNFGSAFQRVMRPQGVALPIINMACSLSAEEAQIQMISLVAGPSAPTPQRLTQLEVWLCGKRMDAINWEAAHQLLVDTTAFRSSAMRASKDYRHVLAKELLKSVITTAWQRAKGRA